MEFGLAVPNFGKFSTTTNIIKFACVAEELGFDSLWLSDHIVLPSDHKGFGRIFYDPLITLSFISQKTKKISLGTSVIILPYRNPVVLAKMFSTLDQLSSGRIIMGFGIGWLEKEFEALGVPIRKKAERSEEYIEIIKELFSKNNPRFKGNFVNFSDIQFYPKPLQKPYPPIWIGGNSNESLSRSLAIADGWHPVGLTSIEIKEKLSPIILESNFTVSVRKNLQFTVKKIIDDKETLRGTEEKILNGLKDYKDAGVTHMVFQVLGNNFDEITHSMEKVIKLKSFL